MTPVLAHISGVPVEELVPVAYGAGAVWLWPMRSRLSELLSRLRATKRPSRAR
jgi:hypothetical protein